VKVFNWQSLHLDPTRDFALRLRAAGSHTVGGAGGRGGGSRRVRTDDVVKDAALPEFKLDFGSLVALLQVISRGDAAGGWAIVDDCPLFLVQPRTSNPTPSHQRHCPHKSRSDSPPARCGPAAA
jgi:hypothetical protein